jgi:hypothetical protein
MDLLFGVKIGVSLIVLFIAMLLATRLDLLFFGNAAIVVRGDQRLYIPP